jgi:hypothetical protein
MKTTAITHPVTLRATALAAEMNVEDIRRAYYDQLDAANDPATQWWWIRVQQAISGKGQLIVDDGEGGLYRVEYDIKGDNVNFADPIPVKIRYEDQPVDQNVAASYVAAGIAMTDPNPTIVYRTREESRDEVEDPEASIAAASVSNGPWDGSASRFTDEQYASSCVLDRADCAADWKNRPPKERYSLPIREPGGALNSNGVAAAAGRLKGTKACPAAKKAAAKRIVAAYGTIKQDPPDYVKNLAASTDTQGGSMDEEQRVALAAKLGLPEEATEEEVLARLADPQMAFVAASTTEGEEGDADGDDGDDNDDDSEGEGEGATQGAGGQQQASPVNAGTTNGTPSVAEDGTVRVDKATWEALQANAQLARRHEDDRVAAADNALIDNAIGDGKFPPSRRGHYQKLLAADREGTTKLINDLASGIIPVSERGTSAGGEEVQAGANGAPGEGLPGDWFPEVPAIQARAARQRGRVTTAKEG